MSQECVAEVRDFIDSYAIGSNQQKAASLALDSLEDALALIDVALDKARAFARGEVQGKCCDLWPECSHILEAVTERAQT